MSKQLSGPDDSGASSIENRLFQEIRQLIDEAKQKVAVAINSELTLLLRCIDKTELMPGDADRFCHGAELMPGGAE